MTRVEIPSSTAHSAWVLVRTFGLGARALLASGGLYPAQAVPANEKFEVVVAKNMMVPMRDGVKLATDVYMPARGEALVPGKFPVLVSCTPYGKDPAPASPGRETWPTTLPTSATWLWCRIPAVVPQRRFPPGLLAGE